MRGEIYRLILLCMGVMAVLGLLRFRFALRFWHRMSRLGYVYVGVIVALAALTLFFGIRL